jgi:hypothetical protein
MPFWLGAPENSFYQAFVRGMSSALEELGHEPVYLPFEESGKYSRDDSLILMRTMTRQAPHMVLDVACWGCGLSRANSPPAFMVSEIPYAAWLFDHPFNQGLNVVVASKLFAVYPDRGHAQQIRQVFQNLKLEDGVFAPPAVQPESAEPPGVRDIDREIDVLYVGNLEWEATERFWHQPHVLRSMPQGFDVSFCDALADEILCRPERPLHLAVETVLRARPGNAVLNLNPHMRLVEHHFRYVFRRDAVFALASAGLSIRVVGKGWKRAGLPANAHLQEPVSYQQMFQLAAHARICLDASTYTDGANDRVFSYMLNGAVCFTNASGYLRTALGDDGGAQFYSFTNLGGLVDSIRFWLARREHLAEAGARGRAAVLGAHTWRHRMQALLNDLMRERSGATG